MSKIIYHLANIETAIRGGYLKHRIQRMFQVFRWKELFWVVRHWRLYYDTINAMHNEWFNIDVYGPVQYMSDPDKLYCKYCSCKYVATTPIDMHAPDAWLHSYDLSCEEDRQQQHLPGCLHYDILKLRSCWR